MKNKKTIKIKFLAVFFLANFFLGGAGFAMAEIIQGPEAVGASWVYGPDGVRITPQADPNAIPPENGVLPNDTRLHDYSASAAVPIPKTVKSFSYPLLEAFPGFFIKGDTTTDLPATVLAIYKFGIWTVGIAGLFMLVVGGFMYMASAGNTSTAGNARGIIADALLGIVAALGAYLILYVINPDLTRLNLSFSPVKVFEGAEDVQVSGTVSTGLVLVDGKQIDASFKAALDKIKASGTSAQVTSGLRTVERQKELIIQNCGGFPATKSCSPPTCLLRNGPASCPHTTGNAADIWALTPNGGQAITQSQCMADINACRNNQYQKELIAGMRAEGFCVLSSEPWHFEKPKMSNSCS